MQITDRMPDKEDPPPGMEPLLPPPPLDEEGNVIELLDENELLQEDEQDVALSTPLNNDPDLTPLRGPPLPDATDDIPVDTRPVFVSYGAYAPGTAASDALHERYVGWLEDAEKSDLTVSHAFYLLSPAMLCDDEEMEEVLEANSVVSERRRGRGESAPERRVAGDGARTGGQPARDPVRCTPSAAAPSAAAPSATRAPSHPAPHPGVD